MRKIFRARLTTLEARGELEALADLVRSGRRVCLLCFEAEPGHCHRSLVATALSALVRLRVTHLAPAAADRHLRPGSPTEES